MGNRLDDRISSVCFFHGDINRWRQVNLAIEPRGIADATRHSRIPNDLDSTTKVVLVCYACHMPQPFTDISFVTGVH
jgi:hypothetical protein